MLSKILTGEPRGGIQPIVWPTTAGGMPVTRAFPPQGQNDQGPKAFEPLVSMDHETAVLRSRLAEMEQTARQAADQARRQGFTEGEAQGRAQAALELEPVIARLGRALEELVNVRGRLRDEAEADVVQLSLAIARRILHRELSVDPGAIEALVQVALDRLARQEIYKIRVHPAQAGALEATLRARRVEAEVQPDPRLETGSLIFETNRGKMDASVTAQFEEIERGLTDRVQRR